MQVIESHQVYTSDLNVECHQAVQREALPIHILGIDRASEMIAEARRRQDTIHEPGLVFLEGDFDAFDRLSGMTSGQSAFFEPEGLVSNFALHWSADVKKLLTRLPRARMMVFSVPVRGTFRELRNPPMLCAFEEIDEVCSTLGYNTFVCERKTWRCGFNSPMEAVRSLKQTGVMHFPRVRSAPVGLMTQDRLKQCFHEPEEISLTY
jgi:hypothetical protein